LLNHLFLRCGATAEEFWQLQMAGFVEMQGDRYQLTALGGREYRKQSRGRYF
jgi:hypothetical protein